MIDGQQETEVVDPATAVADDHTDEEAIAKRAQYGQTGDEIDPGLGHMGGAGASGGIQPDIGTQSAPAKSSF